ncbi:CPBP family intramembrane glutamic endopeptidase [Kosakonia sp. R1.Fl]|uniref:CPBP family intramembrane glutamic endopeptidase n=1 Tax=Kosakonia sp. R1.Fl TaxID=2928706 RepID=UPI00201DAA04|nr:CPBP family intramembrane glutamic endopeptidase [Kosakonia sp. R1.Fl]MCL6746939.1 CPBP family intramembrane metalloprotease [Kosakonia sp. R1.Fl]
MNEKHISFFSHDKKTATTLLFAFLVSIAITALPYLTIKFTTLEASLYMMLIVEFITALGFYFLLLRHYPQYKIKTETKSGFVTKSLLLFFLLLLMHIFVFMYKKDIYHYKASKPEFMYVIALVIFVPFFEEIFYRGCFFGFISSVCKYKILPPALITSVLFCMMHTQYYSLPDQLVLFSLSLSLIYLRVETKSLSYPMLLHSGMNAFVIFLNAQELYR